MKLPVALALSVLLTACGSSQTLRRHGGLALHDLKSLATAPVRADAEAWRRATLITAGVLASASLDDEVDRWMRDHQRETLDDITEVVEPLGGRYSERLLLGMLLYGAAAGNDRSRDMAFDGIVASLLASKAITPAIKVLVGRERPNATTGTFEFDDGSSFPSNHATQAFTVAAVIASHSGERWVDWTAYGLAGLVAFSRMYHDAHYLSDVVAGAAIGVSVGKMVVRENRDERETWSIVPTASSRGAPGVAISIRF